MTPPPAYARLGKGRSVQPYAPRRLWHVTTHRRAPAPPMPATSREHLRNGKGENSMRHPQRAWITFFKSLKSLKVGWKKSIFFLGWWLGRALRCWYGKIGFGPGVLPPLAKTLGSVVAATHRCCGHGYHLLTFGWQAPVHQVQPTNQPGHQHPCDKHEWREFRGAVVRIKWRNLRQQT